MERVQRKIIHIDMDAFFAAIEQRDFPEYRNRPLIVGGDPQSRGVVATCSYEARKFGIHSAMSCKKAIQLCPHAIFVPPRKDIYKTVSTQIRSIFYEYSYKVEPLSIDEAFIDVTKNWKGERSATRIAQEILARIYQDTGLTASAGVSYNKFIAKIASDIRKPNGITVIVPEQAITFLEQLPIEKFYGVGKVTAKRMKKLGIYCGHDLKRRSQHELVAEFGKAGLFFFNIVRGVDNREVEPARGIKSIGRETTLHEDILDKQEIIYILDELCVRVEKLLSAKEKKGTTITLKIKYHDFTTITRSKSGKKPFTTSQQMMRVIHRLLRHTEAGSRKIRLLGITVSNFQDNSSRDFPKQLLLPFPEGQI